MWFDDVYIDPLEVVAVQSWGKKGSKGCIIFTTGGHCFHVESPSTQVATVVNSAKREAIKNSPRRSADMR